MAMTSQQQYPTPEKEAEIRAAVQEDREELKCKNANELLAFSEISNFWKRWMKVIYEMDRQNICFNIILSARLCELHIAFRGTSQSFRWKFFAKKKSALFRRRPKSERMEFRGKTYQTYYHLENELAFKCKKGENLTDALKLLKDLQEIFPVPIYQLTIFHDVFLTSNDPLDNAEVIVKAIPLCHLLSVTGPVTESVQTCLVNEIKVSKHILFDKAHNVISELSKMSKLVQFNLMLDKDVSLTQLLNRVPVGKFCIYGFSFREVNRFLKIWLKSTQKVTRSLSFLINRNDIEYMDGVLFGLYQYGFMGKRWAWRTTPSDLKRGWLTNVGVELYRKDGSVGTIMIVENGPNYEGRYSFVFHVRYQVPLPTAPSPIQGDLELTQKEYESVLERGAFEHKKFEDTIGTLSRREKKQASCYQEIANKSKSLRAAMLQLKVDHCEEILKLLDPSKTKMRQSLGYFTI